MINLREFNKLSGRWIPENSIEQKFDDVNAVVYTRIWNERFHAVAYSGKRNKYDFNFTYRSEEHMNQEINRYVEGLRSSKAAKEQYREERKLTGKAVTRSAETAKKIRVDLKAAFPTIKFSVTSDSFSMGDSVDVRWENGPTQAQVRAVIDKYQDGSFDGMNDIYVYDRSTVGGTKYVCCKREFSEENRVRMMQEICQLMGQNYDGENTKIFGSTSVRDAVWPIFSNSPLMNGFNGVKRTDVTCGSLESFFELY